MSDGRKNYILNTKTVKLGCSAGCTRPRLAALFSRKSRVHHRKPHRSSSSTSSYATTTTTTFSPSSSSSLDMDSKIRSLRALQGFGRIGGQSMAVEKDSDDPYLDFRGSMLQMIREKELYSGEDLRELLSCFLQLNSPYYHGIIVRAFTEIWNGGACSF